MAGGAKSGSVALDRAGREGGHVIEMQQRRLLLAFTEVTAQDGWTGTSVGRVCKQAGVSRRTFYDLFQDREACFLAVLDSAVERISQTVVPVYEQEGRWRERIRRALTALLEFFDGELALAQVCVVETLKAGPEVSRYRRRILDVMTVALDEGRSESKAVSGPPQLTAQSTVGGIVSVIHARILEENDQKDGRSLSELLNPLMSMIVHPYLGAGAARRELEHVAPKPQLVRNDDLSEHVREPFKDLPIRITFRTARVLATIATQPGTSNREIGQAAGVSDQGQISKLLRRLRDFGLIENHGPGQPKGEANAWKLTPRGRGVQQAISARE